MQVIDKLSNSIKGMSKLEATVTVVGSIEPIAAIPQITRVYSTKSAEDLAPATWWFGLFTDSLWTYWGIKSKNFPIMITGVLWVLFDVAILYAMSVYA